MLPLVRPFVAIALVAGALSPFVLLGRSASSAPLATTDPILELHADGLTTYRYSANTPIQGIRPMAGQRGVSLDGSYRALPSQRMAIQGNPFEDTWDAFRVNDMRLDLGTYQAQDVDIAMPAKVPWLIGRSFNARQEDSSGTPRDSNGYQGYNCFQNSQPEIRLHDTAPDSKDKVYVVYGADRFAEYRRDTGSSYFLYRGTNGNAGLVRWVNGSGSEPDTYVLRDQNGNVITFFGFDSNSGVAKGQLWKIVDAADNAAYIGDASTGSTAITNGFNSSGYVTTAYDSSGRRYSYTYSSFDSVSRLSQVKAEKNTGSWVTVATVDYDYYLSGQSNGSSGDLKKVTITTPLSDSGVDLVQKKYYRYYTGSYHATDNPGYPHGIKYIVDFEGTRKRDWEDSTFDEDFLNDSDTTLAEYASAYFEYDSSHRVRKAWFNGQCGCGSGNQNGTFEFTYDTNGSFSDNTSAYDTTWKTRTVVERPDLSYVTQYWDEANQPLSRVVTNQDPSITSPAPEKWVTAITRDSNGMVTSIASPANCTGYTHSSGSISSSSTVGLVNDFVRQSSGATKSFAITRYFKEGQTTQYYEREWEWTSVNKAVVDMHIIRPLRDKVHDYHVQGTSTSNRVTTDYAPTAYSSSIALEKNPFTDPVISASNNGSGTATGGTPFFRTDATMSFEEARDGVIHYREFTDGLLTELIEDADTGETSDFDVSVPSGLASESGAFHRITTYAYDNQGRLDATTYADGRKVKRYYSKLADGRPVTLEYNDYATSPSTKYYGPVEYTVANLIGKVEVSAVVGLTGDESTLSLSSHVDESNGDFIAAMDLGSIERLRTFVHDKSGGQLRESRDYFTVPSSGEGDATNNYDPTPFGYDDLGRRDRVKEAHGTIRNWVYDDLGRVVSIWMGTNDAEETGTDDMVMIESREYDGGNDDGNGYLTERTLRVEDDADNERVTTYTNDVRGRVLLESRPETPHVFHKYDNQGRRLATGSFSSTASIVVGTDDPTTETANRLALSESAFDELGRMWKSLRHNIDPSDGSDDDSLSHLLWRDEDGRVLKADGPELAKYAYHRLGWQTHKFTLAEDNDSAYSDVDDVTGDYVVEEDQNAYDTSTGEVWMQVNIQRFHDDWGGGSTTGALDTNADADPMKVTAADLKGRPQITGYWYDRFWRRTDEVLYGTNGGSDVNRGTISSPPARSDIRLRTTYAYGTHGDVKDTTDPRALVMQRQYDAFGRVTKEVRNYTDGTPTAPDLNQTVVYTFTDGLMTTMLVDMPGSDNQATTYTYGTTKGTSVGDSKIGTKHLLQKVTYPDQGVAQYVDDVVRMAYNAQGQLLWRQDQRHSTSDTANVTEFDYDDVGRLEQERVTTPGTGFDTAVLRIGRTYDSLGRPDLLTQYDAASGGTVLDEVKYGYDGWGNVTKFEQDLNSAVGASGSVDDYEFASAYDDFTAGRNTLRRTSMTLPGGRSITLNYGLNKDGSLSRVSKLLDGGTTLVTYDYLGVGFEIGATYPQPDVYGIAYGSSAGSYPDLDRFNRITRSDWTSDVDISVEFYDCEVSYDRNSNITWVEDEVHSGRDVKYTMDGLDRVTDAEEGTKSGSSIVSLKRRQQWTTLSHTGNWSRAKLDLDGDGTYTDSDEYDDTRSHNAANEIETRDLDSTSGTTGDNYTLTSDAVGNLTNDGKEYKYEYDAFRRLRRIKNQSDALVGEYRYNGLGYLIEIHEDTGADGVDDDDPWFHPLYDETWRVVGTARSAIVSSVRVYDASPKEDYVLQMAGLDGRGGSSYINGVVCRNRDAGTNGASWAAQSDGTLEERYFYCQNWRGDISALVTSGRRLHEWGKFSPYGVPNCLPGADTNSDGDCDESDINQINTWRTSTPAHYDVRGDVDLDHDVDATDENLASSGVLGGATFLGWGKLSNSGIRNGMGYAGYVHSSAVPKAMPVRHRAYSADLGKWQQRDPLGYMGDPSLYAYVTCRPLVALDPQGTCPGGQGCPLHGPDDPPSWGDPCYHLPPCERCLCYALEAYFKCYNKAALARFICKEPAPVDPGSGHLGGAFPSARFIQVGPLPPPPPPSCDEQLKANQASCDQEHEAAVAACPCP